MEFAPFDLHELGKFKQGTAEEEDHPSEPI